MPRTPRYRIAALADLAAQLRFAPNETRLRQMRNAEQLHRDVDPQQDYPDDFITFRITGYRTDRAALPAMTRGADLIPDLATLIQQLSLDLALPPDHDGRRAIPLDEVATKLNVSLKTIQRLRRNGLVCHYVIFEESERRLAVFDDSLRRFCDLHEQRLREAARYNRMSRDEQAQVLEQAAELHRRDGHSRNAAARTLAGARGRGSQTLRALLQRHDAAAARPIFDEHGKLSERDLRLIHRAVRFGVPIGMLAKRFGKTRMTMHRALNRRRAELLRGLRLRHVELPTFKLPEAASVILAAPSVISGLDEHVDHDVALLIAQAREPDLDDRIEQPMVAAYNYLKRRAAPAVAALGDWPGAGEIDVIETDLRWAAMIKRRLTKLALPAAIARIEAHLGRGLLEQPTERIIALLRQSLEITAQVIETIDPSRRQRLARVVGLNVDRALASRADELATRRAAARHAPGTLQARGLFDHVCPWRAWLELPVRLRVHLQQLDPHAGELVQRRYGLDGRPPLTLAGLATQSKVTTVTAARRLASAEAQLRALARKAA